MVLIGIAGKMGSGKDTLANKLEIHKGYTKISFASRLKELVWELFCITKKDPNGRKVLQDVGAFMRTIDSKVWINAALKKASKLSKVVITDVRYKNEAKEIIAAGGIVFVLCADDDIRKYRIEKRDGKRFSLDEWEEMNKHQSEIGIDKIIESVPHYELDANKSSVEVFDQLKKILYK